MHLKVVGFLDESTALSSHLSTDDSEDKQKLVSQQVLGLCMRIFKSPAWIKLVLCRSYNLVLHIPRSKKDPISTLSKLIMIQNN